MSTENQAERRYVIKNSCGPDDISYYSRAQFALVGDLQYATRYKEEAFATSDREWVHEYMGGFTEIVPVDEDEKSWRITEVEIKQPEQ